MQFAKMFDRMSKFEGESIKKERSMRMKDRKNQILELLEAESFLTVKGLSQKMFASESSIRRDLTALQNQGLVRRTHGGVVLSDSVERVPSLNSRMRKNIAGKRKIAQKAATLLEDGQTVMLDGSSTAGFLVPYVAKHKGMTLFTNNMETALKAIEFGIVTHCIGGRAVNCSAVLAGEEAYHAVTRLHPDILFFSSQCLNADGVISDSNKEENYLRMLMLEAAETGVFLCDSEKFDTVGLYRLTTVDAVDAVILDTEWDRLRAECRRL